MQYCRDCRTLFKEQKTCKCALTITLEERKRRILEENELEDQAGFTFEDFCETHYAEIYSIRALRRFRKAVMYSTTLDELEDVIFNFI